MAITLREMSIEDYNAAYQLWETSPGVGLSSSDAYDSIARYLDRNPGLSFVACDGPKLIGTVLGGHDSRRGYIYHLAVDLAYRKRGIGRDLVGHCIAALGKNGIEKCHIFVFGTNDDALAFWKNCGWTERVELVILSKYTAPGDGS